MEISTKGEEKEGNFNRNQILILGQKVTKPGIYRTGDLVGGGAGLILFKYIIALSKCRNVEGVGVTWGKLDGQKQKRIIERFTLIFILKEQSWMDHSFLYQMGFQVLGIGKYTKEAYTITVDLTLGRTRMK